MTTTQNGRRIAFLAGPFKGIVDPETGMVRAFERARFEALINHLEARGYAVFNAHKRESWGASMMTPEECTRIDYENIRDCDLFVAFPGYPASPGTHIELGWASALGKPMLVLLEEGHKYAYLLQGLHVVGDVSYVNMPTDEIGLMTFATALEEVEARLSAGGTGGSDEQR